MSMCEISIRGCLVWGSVRSVTGHHPMVTRPLILDIAYGDLHSCRSVFTWWQVESRQPIAHTAAKNKFQHRAQRQMYPDHEQSDQDNSFYPGPPNCWSSRQSLRTNRASWVPLTVLRPRPRLRLPRPSPPRATTASEHITAVQPLILILLPLLLLHLLPSPLILLVLHGWLRPLAPSGSL